ncbi:hypothetical protein QE152_g34314 [Popillia japonica]|uniref:Uncharacterized protein n=1 Tax=Popillia japonica TaxID=7064 RepID=A0AAW1IU91_POPJA
MCINIIKEAYINSTKEGPRGEKRVPYWWSVEIEAERKECKSMRREYTRMSKKRDKEEEKLLAKKRYNESKKDLRKLIMQSKREHWKKLCNELNNDIWGEGYRLAMKGIKHLVPYEIPAREKKEIVKQLFPQSANATENYRKIVASVPKFTETELHTATQNSMKTGKIVASVPKFTDTELHTATQSMKTGKAPGMDGIPAEAVKEVVKSNGQWLLKVLNELLKIQNKEVVKSNGQWLLKTPNEKEIFNEYDDEFFNQIGDSIEMIMDEIMDEGVFENKKENNCVVVLADTIVISSDEDDDVSSDEDDDAAGTAAGNKEKTTNKIWKLTTKDVKKMEHTENIQPTTTTTAVATSSSSPNTSWYSLSTTQRSWDSIAPIWMNREGGMMDTQILSSPSPQPSATVNEQIENEDDDEIIFVSANFPTLSGGISSDGDDNGRKQKTGAITTTVSARTTTGAAARAPAGNRKKEAVTFVAAAPTANITAATGAAAGVRPAAGQMLPPRTPCPGPIPNDGQQPPQAKLGIDRNPKTHVQTCLYLLYMSGSIEEQRAYIKLYAKKSDRNPQCFK